MAAPLPVRGTPQPTGIHVVFSGNWAAVVGIVVCIFLLCLWFQVTAPPEEDDLG